jgi:hypothetical protein
MKHKILSALSVRFQILSSALLVICSIGYLSPAQAQLITHAPLVSPLQTGHYMPGFLNIRDYADPSPISGLLVLDYGPYQFGNNFYGRDGKPVTQITGPFNRKIDLDLNVNGYYNTPMVLWVSKGKILGATYFGGAAIPFVTVSPNLAFSRIGDINAIHKSGDISGSVTGFSDLNLLPAFLSWGHKTYDITAGWMVYAPTGRYVTGGDDNTGFGYWSNTLQLFGYWYPMKIDGQHTKALAVMLGGTFELISKIKDAEVKPGNRLSLDYGISQYVSKRVEVGVYGGNNWQISEDEGSQVYWDRSVKDRLGVMGFQLGYWFWKERLEVLGKYGFNYGAIQRFEQNTVQLNFIFVTMR